MTNVERIDALAAKLKGIKSESYLTTILTALEAWVNQMEAHGEKLKAQEDAAVKVVVPVKRGKKKA